MKKKFWALLLALAMLALAGCVDDGPTTMVDLRFDEGDSLALRQGWYLEDGSCLLYGDYVGAKGRQGRLYWLDKPGEEPACVWPQAGDWFALEDELLAYYLPGQQTAVLSNQTRHEFLLFDAEPGKTYDTPQGNRQKVTLPEVEAQGDLEMCLWLGKDDYLLGRSVYGEEAEPRAVQLSHLYGTQGHEIPIAELPGRVCDVKVDAERNRLLVLSSLGGLVTVDLSEEPNIRGNIFNCVQDWPTPSPFNEYRGVWPVQAAKGDYVVLESSCEDGIYYQVVDLDGDELGVYKAATEKGGGLLAAYGHAIYVVEYSPEEAEAATDVLPGCHFELMMFDFVSWEADTINSGGYGGRPQENLDSPQRFGPASGAISPDGKEMLWFCWEYVTARYHFPDSIPVGGLR